MTQPTEAARKLSDDEAMAAMMFDLMTHAMAELHPGDAARIALVNESWETTATVNKQAYLRMARGVNAHIQSALTAARNEALEEAAKILDENLSEIRAAKATTPAEGAIHKHVAAYTREIAELIRALKSEGRG